MLDYLYFGQFVFTFYLEKEGFRVPYLDVDETGMVKLSELMHYIDDDTILVSIMCANNEVGTIQYLKAISHTCKEKENLIFHTDCVQAFSHFNIDVKELEIDALTISSHKIYGPKGAGCLYVKSGIKIDNLIYGGNQERAKRGGTLNAPAIVGFGKAVEIATRDMHAVNAKLKMLRDYLYNQIMEKIPGVTLNGHNAQKLPHILNLRFDCIDSESLITMLDLDGICVSNGSACTSGSNIPSHVLEAMGLNKQQVNSSVRFSISKSTTKDDIDYTVEKLAKNVERLREMSPLSLKGGKK